MIKNYPEEEAPKYFNPLNIETLTSEISDVIDTIKHLYSLSPEVEDYNKLTPQLAKAFKDAAAASSELQDAYNYYRLKRKDL